MSGICSAYNTDGICRSVIVGFIRNLSPLKAIDVKRTFLYQERLCIPQDSAFIIREYQPEEELFILMNKKN